MASSVFIVISMRYIAAQAASWTLRPDLIRTDCSIASGVFNDTIFLIGGYYNSRQMTKYHINSQQFTDLGLNAVGDDFDGDGQYWTQQQHIIYATHLDQFNIYNMETNEYIGNWKGITLSETTCNGEWCFGCLASSENYLFVTGGMGSVTLQLLSLSSFEWISNAPQMNSPRGRHACITNNDFLFVFGGTGTDPGEEIDLNERVRITNIAENTWNNVDPLTLKLSSLRAASLADIIYIIGGRGGATSNTDKKQTIVHVMNANTGSIEVFSDELPLSNAYGSPIIVDGILFVMGGFFDSGVITSNYAYYPLFTIAPTPMPTSTPSPSPTTNPSDEPTMNPSKYVNSVTISPTSNPTPMSSALPTPNPFIEPTSFPSAAPTMKPSPAPTAPPSSIPTANPSNILTHHPTDSPLSTTINNRTPSPTEKPTQSTADDTTEAPHDVPTPSESSTTVIIAVVSSLCIILAFVYILRYIVPYYKANREVKTVNDQNKTKVMSGQATTLDVKQQMNDVRLPEIEGKGVHNRSESLQDMVTSEGPNKIMIIPEDVENKVDLCEDTQKTQIVSGEQNLAEGEFIVCGDDEVHGTKTVTKW